MSNASQIQLQIKAFNKALSRADKAGTISDEIYEAISDLIGFERMTKSGYGKAGIQYLSDMSPKELMSYSSDIEAARNMLKLDKIIGEFDIGDYKDKKALLWKLYDELMDEGKAFDSDQVKSVADGDVNIDYKQMVLQMYKYKNDPEYGLSDVAEWYESQVGLE